MSRHLLSAITLFVTIGAEITEDSYVVTTNPAGCATCDDTSTSDLLMACYNSMSDGCVLNLVWKRTITFDASTNEKSCLSPNGLGLSLSDPVVTGPTFPIRKGLIIETSKDSECSDTYPFQLYVGSGPGSTEEGCGAVAGAQPGSPFQVTMTAGQLHPQLSVSMFDAGEIPYLGFKPTASCLFPGQPITFSMEIKTTVAKGSAFIVSGSAAPPDTESSSSAPGGDESTAPSSPNDPSTTAAPGEETSSLPVGGDQSSTAPPSGETQPTEVGSGTEGSDTTAPEKTVPSQSSEPSQASGASSLLFVSLASFMMLIA